MMRFDYIFFFSISFSCLIHFVVINLLIEKQIEKEKIVIFDLSEFREVAPVQQPKNIKKKSEKKDVNKKLKDEKKIEKQKVAKVEKSIEKVPIFEKKKKLENETFEKKKKLENETQKQELEKKEKSIDDNIQNDLQRNNKISKPVVQVDKNQKRINDESLLIYLKKFSKFLNIKAIDSYPKQSKKRREEGTILTQINIDSEGNIIDFIILTKKPQRLAKATKNVISKVKNFDKPPKHLFIERKTFLVEIKINFRIY